jgi:hypothetical protein
MLKLRKRGCVYVAVNVEGYCGLRNEFVLLVVVREALKSAEYSPPPTGVNPLTPPELKNRRYVTAPLTAPPILDAVGVAAVS